MVTSLDTAKTYAGPMRVFINGSTAGVTEGTATVEIEKETNDIHTNEFGLVDKVIAENGAVITVNFAQIEPSVLALAVPEAQLVTSGTRTLLYGNSTRGRSLLGVAQPLVLSGTNGVVSEQWTFRKAFVEEGFEVEYGDEQTVVEVKFRAVPDPTNPTGVDSLFKYEIFPT